MKKLLIFSYIFTAIIAQSFGALKQIKVNTAEEFLNSIGDNREIIICAEEGILLTPTLSDMIEKNKIKQFDSQTRAKQVGVFFEHETDGPTIVISGYKNLTIRSEVNDRRTIEVTPRYAFVFNFISCENIKFENLLLGHTKEGTCSNGVLGFDDCKNVTIENCGLYGCGTEGIVARMSSNINMTNSEIFECSYSILHLFGCSNVNFKNCYFYNNKEYDLVGINDRCENVIFENCAFAGNKGSLLNIDRNDNVTLKRCLISHQGEQIGNREKVTDYDSIWILE